MLSTDGSADGTVTVTFTAPVDGITIEYGSHALAPANPGQQGMALHDIIFCRPTTNLAIAKTRSEEQTSELQSLMRTSSDGFCLKKKKTQQHNVTAYNYRNSTL